MQHMQRGPFSYLTSFHLGVAILLDGIDASEFRYAIAATMEKITHQLIQ